MPFKRVVVQTLLGVAVTIGVTACGGGDGASTAPPVALPAITAFTATPAFVAPGQSSVLNWTATGATTVTAAVGRPIGLVVDTAKVAAESVVSDGQTLQAPPVRLYYSGDNEGRSSANAFQMQFILSDGAWALGSNPERALRLEI